MKEYLVTIPCTMAVCVAIEAESEQEAKELSMQVDFRVDVTAGDGFEFTGPEITAFETHSQVCRGNVYSGCINEIEVQEA